MSYFKILSIALILVLVPHFVIADSDALHPDERPGEPDEWGFRPADGEVLAVTPGGFVWRPQEGAGQYGLQIGRDAGFAEPFYTAEGLDLPVHCPVQPLPPGSYYWRFRFHDGNQWSEWSSPRRFTIPEDATAMPLPERRELLGRIPDSHPRLFVRPEWMNQLRTRTKTDLEPLYDELIQQCEELLADPPSTVEPPTYPEGTERGSDPWREIWWGNREYTQEVLNGAATLAFAYLLSGDERYARLSRRLLMECAEWDPVGATGFVYNDEAGMPYNYYFSRTYTFLHDYLSEDEREKCREVMLIRGREMYSHLHPNHLWRPYGSHNNRSWHFLGEVGIAFHEEIPEAADWVWFAMNVFMNVYPVWSDTDGGWHEGFTYWRSYIDRFTWWADAMRAALGINAFDKPYFSKAGYYAMYLTPPGTKSGGFGDRAQFSTSGDSVDLVAILAAQAQNSHWQWFVEAHEDEPRSSGYVGFIRGALPKVAARPPADLPTSRLFEGIGQAMLNSNIMDVEDNVGLVFKSSPLGTQSHGYESQNAFLLHVYGESVFIRSGQRDNYGSDHHRNWMWQTKSVNSITINGQSQLAHSPAALGRITAFKTSERFDWVVGEAGTAYPEGVVDRFTRRILFLKPEVIVIHDILETPEPSTFEWLLHAPTEMRIRDQRDILALNNDAACRVTFLWPENLKIAQTDQFEVPPRPRIQLTQYHLTATPSEQSEQQEFVTVLRPHRSGDKLRGEAGIRQTADGFLVEVPVSDGTLKVSLGKSVEASLETKQDGEGFRFSSGD